MKIFKPHFWDKKIGFYSIILFPITILVIFFIFLKRKLIITRSFNLPIVCIGNIYLGGTGKTPLAIELAKEMEKRGKRPVIIKKYYNSQKDEHELIKNHFKNLILKKDRSNAINEAILNNFDIVILDDGFQDYKIKKNLNIICFNQNQLIGNGLIIPSGPLRESLDSLKKAQVVIINGEKDEIFEEKILRLNKNLKVFYSIYKPLNLEDFKDKKVVAFAGIGNPTNFFKLLEKNNLNIKKKFIYPDHYNLKKNEIINIINYAKQNICDILTTEKDFFRLKKYNFKEIKYLKLKLIIEKKEEFLNYIFKTYDQNN